MGSKVQKLGFRIETKQQRLTNSLENESIDYAVGLDSCRKYKTILTIEGNKNVEGVPHGRVQDPILFFFKSLCF